MWTEWQRLKDAVDTAQMPAAAQPIAGASVEMMMGADLQWAPLSGVALGAVALDPA